MSRHRIQVKDSYECNACFNYVNMDYWNAALIDFSKEDEPEIRGLYNVCKRCENVCAEKYKLKKVGRRMTKQDEEDCEDLSDFVIMTRQMLEALIGEKAVERITNKLDREF
jgi:hypothetical protein